MPRRTGGADALRLSTLVRTPGDPSSERGSDSAAALSKGDANQIRHHQPQELTVRENGAGPLSPPPDAGHLAGVVDLVRADNGVLLFSDETFAEPRHRIGGSKFDPT